MGNKLASYDDTGAITAFYDTADSPPPAGAKVIELTDEQHRSLLAGQAAGKRMAVDTNGVPVLLDPLPLSRDQIATQKRALRDAALTATDWLVARHQDEKLIGNGTTLTADQFAVLLKYRQALRDISNAPGWPNIDLPAAPDFVTAIA